MQMINGDDIINLADGVVYVYGEVTADGCEDRYFFHIDRSRGIIAVMDGCGGLGAARYEAFYDHKGGYLASRFVGEAVKKWFIDNFTPENYLSGDEISDAVKAAIDYKLSEESRFAGEITALKGGLTRPFPTTLSAVIFDKGSGQLRLRFLWAGDSRGYILSPYDGLMQLTRDDIKGDADAMSNLTDDTPLSNVISSDGRYKINNRVVKCETPFIALTATDGCFGYLKSPMEFEYLLLTTLLESESLDNWQSNLKSKLKKYAADDYTLVAVPFGFGSFDNLKKQFITRANSLYKRFIKPSYDNPSEITALWEDYKIKYGGYIK